VSAAQNFKRLSGWIGFAMLALGMSACNLPVDPRNVSSVGRSSDESQDWALRNLCDVDRVRARSEVLRRFEVDRFRDIALRISKNLTRADVTDLLRLASARDPGPGMRKRRVDLIGQIYSDAIARAGYRAGFSSRFEDSPWSYVVEIDPLSSGNDLYVNLVTGNVKPDAGLGVGEAGAVEEVILGAYPDQSRYWITLSRVYRTESQPGGGATSLYEGVSLSQYVDEMLPRQCAPVGSGLDPESFNTVAGLPQAEP
jgi:hypothetical protein